VAMGRAVSPITDQGKADPSRMRGRHRQTVDAHANVSTTP
jgi:hypothetical protein